LIQIAGQQGGRGTTFALEHNFEAGQLAPDVRTGAELYGGYRMKHLSGCWRTTCEDTVSAKTDRLTNYLL
jgi:hypothetical protein